MTAATLFEAAGGLALFLLAMGMMTDGLRLFGGRNLKTLLERSTATRWRGLAVGEELAQNRAEQRDVGRIEGGGGGGFCPCCGGTGGGYSEEPPF